MLLVAACGGGSTTTEAPSTGSAPPPAPPNRGPNSLSDQQRVQAATATAQSADNACSPVRPFYWEIGNRDAALASGSVSSGTSNAVYTAKSLMSMASASKWLYASYVVQRRGGLLTDEDTKFLNFRSGYTNFDQCEPSQTVGECDASGTNGDYTAANAGEFFYNGGHMESHATLNGLAGMNNQALATEIRSQLGTDIALSYSQPQLAGGIYMTPTAYALALRKMISGQLMIGHVAGHPRRVHESQDLC